MGCSLEHRFFFLCCAWLVVENVTIATTTATSITIFFKLFIYLFWLCWVFVFVRGLSLVADSGGHSSLQCAGLSLSWPLLLRSTGSRCTGSVVVAHGPSCSVACGIFPDQGSNPCPLHRQADSQPLRPAPPGKPLVLLLLRITTTAVTLLGLFLNGGHSFKCFMYIYSFNTYNSKRYIMIIVSIL